MVSHDKPLFSFGVVSDVQYSELETQNLDERPAYLGIEKLAAAVNEFNKHGLEFVVNLGDLIDRDVKSFPPILDVMNKAKAPIWYVLGNHDFCGPEYDYGNKQQALDAFGMAEDTRYYYKDTGDWRFIVLDTNEVGVIEDPEGTEEFERGRKALFDAEAAGKINAKEWNGGLSDEQVDWLRELINSTAKSMNIVVFAHHSVYPVHRENLLNYDVVLDLLSGQENIKAFINGHNHDGDYGVKEGVHYWTIEGMMDYKDKTAYAIVDVYADKLEVHGFGRVESRTLDLQL